MIFWRYLLTRYFQVLILSVAAFLAVLLTTRLQEIAYFAALGASGLAVLKFALYQIPYILPIVMPIAALLSAMLLVQNLSQHHEMTALRTAGLGLRRIFTPILLAATLLVFLNFYLVSELSTSARLSTRLLEKELRTINPLLLLENASFFSQRGLFVQTSASRPGESVSDLIIAMPHSKSGKINLLVAKSFNVEKENLIGKQVTLLSGTDDNLLIDNISELRTSSTEWMGLMEHRGWRINNDYLTLPLLLVRIQEGGDVTCYSDLIRRLSLSLAPLTFTLLGLACGMRISRNRSLKGIVTAILLASLYMVAFFVAKGVEKQFAVAASLYLIPHLLIVAAAITILTRIAKGKEV